MSQVAMMFFGLGAVEADAFDEGFESGDAQFVQCLRCIGFFVERPGRPVHAFVGGLQRKE